MLSPNERADPNFQVATVAGSPLRVENLEHLKVVESEFDSLLARQSDASQPALDVNALLDPFGHQPETHA